MSLKWFFLAWFIFAPSQVAGQSLTYGLKGQEVIWKPTLTYQPDDILWKHNGNKVVEFNGQEQQEFGQHQNRIIMNWFSAELTISDLRYEDNGLYELEVSKDNRDFLRFPYRLEVIDKVAKPTISCQMDDGSDSKDSGMLVCSAEPRQPESLMKYEWSSRGTLHPGQNLTIPLGETHNDQVYRCNVSNPLSSETATFTAKDCYSNQSSTVAIAVVVPIIALLVLVGLVVLFLKRKRTGSDKKGKELTPLLHSGSTGQPLAQVQNDETEIISENDRKEQDETPQKGRVKAIAKQLDENNPGKGVNKEFAAGSDKKGKEYRPLLGSGSTPPQVQNDETEIISENDRKEQDETPQKGRVKAIAKQLDENNPGKGVNKEFAAGSDKKGKEYRPLLGSGSTPPQDLDKNKDEHENITLPPPSFPHSESPSSQEQNNLARSDKGDADADQPEESAEKKEEEDPADMSEMEPSPAPEQPESEKESDEYKERKSPPAVPQRPSYLPRTRLTLNSPNTLPEDTAEDRTEEASLDQVSGETVRDDSMEAETSSTSPERKDSETSLHKQDKDKDKMDKSASAVENESDSEGDGELKDKEDLYLAASDQPQSPSPAKPDNSTIQESADTAQADPDQEEKGKTRHESGEGEGKIVEDKN